jgi:hypothetical protein
MTYRALLIGNSTFDLDASLNPLNAPTKDVARLHRALVDGETGLFDDENVRLVTERRHDESWTNSTSSSVPASATI